MKEETVNTLNNSLISILDKTISGVEKGVEFLSSEIPDVIRQLLLWHGVRSFIFFTVGIAWFCAATYGAKKIYKSYKNSDGGWDGMEPLGVFYMIFYIPVLIMCNLEWLQIWLAPKVWLIEYAASLIK